MLKFKNPYNPEEEMDVSLTTDRYVHGNGLYVGMYYFDEEDQFWEPWADISVNLPHEALTDMNCAFIDVNNAGTLPSFLVENGLAKPTGRFGYSGYCAYPEFRFDLDKLNEHLLKKRKS